MKQADRIQVAPGGKLCGAITVPGDKSISHRAVMLGALADGVSTINGCLLSADVQATIDAFRAMGVTILVTDDKQVVVEGAGMHGLRAPDSALDLGNSGTSMRLLTGLLAGQGIPVRLIGDSSLSQRPMRRVIDPLARMGAKIQATEGGTAPLQILPCERLHGIDYRSPVASAQIKSAILLAGLYADGRTCVDEPAPSRDHTERMLQASGVALEREGLRACLAGGQSLHAVDIDVPGDISSAAFFLVGAAIAPGSDLTLTNIGVNPRRSGVIDILRQMGAEINLSDEIDSGAEPTAVITVRGAELQGTEIKPEQVPGAIDEFPALFIAAACARGVTTVTGAAELRVKESDRLAVMHTGLARLGIRSELLTDGIRIHGGALHGGDIDSHGDHRIAMAFAMAALRAQDRITVNNAANIGTSFPGFVPLARQCGLQIQ